MPVTLSGLIASVMGHWFGSDPKLSMEIDRVPTELHLVVSVGVVERRGLFVRDQ